MSVVMRISHVQTRIALVMRVIPVMIDRAIQSSGGSQMTRTTSRMKGSWLFWTSTLLSTQNIHKSTNFLIRVGNAANIGVNEFGGNIPLIGIWVVASCNFAPS